MRIRLTLDITRAKKDEFVYEIIEDANPVGFTIDNKDD